MITKESRMPLVFTVATIMVIGLAVNYLALRAVRSGEPAPGLEAPDAVKAIAGYRKWTKVNPNSYIMLPRAATDCSISLLPAGTDVGGENNPHKQKYITVYVNASGRQAMMEQAKPKFPKGTVIVKEKLPEPLSQTPELLTVMIKREQGFNPESGDWEYAVFDGTGTKLEARGKLENCQGCHLAKWRTDYIFRTYLPNDIRGKLK